MDKRLFREVLDSKQILANEVAKSVDEMTGLLDTIDEKEKRIIELQALIDSMRSEINSLDSDLETLEEESKHFTKEVERLFLKENEEFVWDVETRQLEVHHID